MADKKDKDNENNAPLGATPIERIENGTASNDDMIQVSQEVKNGETTVPPNVETEMITDGLLPPNNENQGEINPPNNETTVPPNTSNGDGVPPTTTPPNNENSNIVSYNRQDAMDSLMSGLNMADESKNKVRNIFQAYKDGIIDESQRNYFLGDAIARMAQDWENRWERGVNRLLWNPDKGVTVPEASSGDSEWQTYLKTDWQAAQKLKNEVREKAVKALIERDVDNLEKANKQHYIYNVAPRLYKDSNFAKLSDEERVNFLMINSINNGSPLSADNLNDYINTLDMVNTAKGKKQAEYYKILAENEGLDWSNSVKEITAKNEERKQELDLQYKQGQITKQDYDNELQKIKNQEEIIELAIATATQEYKVDMERAKLVKEKWGNAVFEIKTGFGPWGAGAKVTGAEIANLGYNIEKMLKDSILSEEADKTQKENIDRAAGLVPNDYIGGY